MSDREARALGAGEPITVDGKDYTLKPVAMRELKEVQKAALRYFKREYLQTYKDQAEFLPEGTLEKKVEEVARWDINDLPRKHVYQVGGIVITDKVKKRLEQVYGELPKNKDGTDDEDTMKALFSAALDGGEITPEQVKEDTDKLPRRFAVAYDAWWITAVYDGMTTLIWTSLRQSANGLKYEDVEQWPFGKIIEASRIIERLTSPSLGNT